MSQQQPKYIVIGDSVSMTSILIDPLTGLEISTTDSEKNPFELIESHWALLWCAVKIVEFAQFHSPRGPCPYLIESAKRLLRGDPRSEQLMKRVHRRFWNVAMTATYMGVKRGDSSAGTLMAAHALGKPPAEAARMALRNVQLMTMLYEDRRGVSLRKQLDDLVEMVVSKAMAGDMEVPPSSRVVRGGHGG